MPSTGPAIGRQSAVTVATKNAINSLFELGIPPDLLVHLACQAEYGTGVRAGSLDQATEQKGRAGQGTLISSNPKENYRIIGTYPVPADRFQIVAVQAGKDGYADDLRLVRRSGLGFLEHRPAACGVDGEDGRLQRPECLHRFGDRVGDVVQLEVEEDRQA